MYFLKGDNTIFFDVDNTLILWNCDPEDPRTIWIPSLKINKALQSGVIQYETVPVVPHEKHLLMIKRHKQLGNTVVVWSKSGPEWAKNIVEYFNLSEYVDLVCGKPAVIYDDLKPDEFLTDCRFLDNKV
jgi:hypothetical protein